MKIVQTFWSGGQNPENVIKNSGGWLLACHHWQAWALSVLQLRQFYDEVELITDAAGKHILIDVLQLPYTSVRVVLDAINNYPPELWALAKIYAYSLQTKPFIHVDGDVFIWKSFDNSLEEAPLIAQNLEINFEIYKENFPLIEQKIKERPNFLNAKQSGFQACNTGIIGGTNVSFFQDYTTQIFRFIEYNKTCLCKISTPFLNNYFEQYFYQVLANKHRLQVKCLFEPIENPLYPNFSDFHDVPYKTTFIHSMGAYKQNETVCKHLAKRLRQDYPEIYYKIIDLCQTQNLPVWACYPIQSLDNNWQKRYEKDKANYKEIEMLFSKPEAEILATVLHFSTDSQINEQGEAEYYKQRLFYPDIVSKNMEMQELDSLNMILLDTFLEKNSIANALDDLKPYFYTDSFQPQDPIIKEIVFSRIKDFIFQGVLKLPTLPFPSVPSMLMLNFLAISEL